MAESVQTGGNMGRYAQRSKTQEDTGSKQKQIIDELDGYFPIVRDNPDTDPRWKEAMTPARMKMLEDEKDKLGEYGKYVKEFTENKNYFGLAFLYLYLCTKDDDKFSKFSGKSTYEDTFLKPIEDYASKAEAERTKPAPKKAEATEEKPKPVEAKPEKKEVSKAVPVKTEKSKEKISDERSKMLSELENMAPSFDERLSLLEKYGLLDAFKKSQPEEYQKIEARRKELERGDYKKLSDDDLKSFHDETLDLRSIMPKEETILEVKARADHDSKEIDRYVKPDINDPLAYYIGPEWFKGLKTTIDSSAHYGTTYRWVYDFYFDRDTTGISDKVSRLEAQYYQFSIFYSAVFNSVPAINPKDVALLTGYDPSKPEDLEKLKELAAMASGQPANAEMSLANLQRAKEVLDSVPKEYRSRMMAPFYSQWHTDYVRSKGGKATGTYEDFFTAMGILLSDKEMSKLVSLTSNVDSRLATFGTIKFDFGTGTPLEYQTSQAITKFEQLSPDLKAELNSLFERKYGKDWVNTMDMDGWQKFIILLEQTSTLPRAFAPYLVEQIGDKLLEYSPYALSQVLNVIVGYSNVFYSTYDIKGLSDYYSALPGKMDRLFTDIFDIKEDTKKRPGQASGNLGFGYLTTGQYYLMDTDQEYGQYGSSQMDLLSKDVRVKLPSESSPYVQLYSPSSNAIIRIPREVYRSYVSGGFINETPATMILEAPAASPNIFQIPHEWFETPLVEVYVTKPVPPTYPILALDKLYVLAPDMLPKTGDFNTANVNSALSGTTATNSVVTGEDGSKTETAVDTSTLMGSASGGGKSVSLSWQKTGSQAVSSQVGSKEAGYTDNSSSQGTMYLNSMPGVVESGSLLYGNGYIQGRASESSTTSATGEKSVAAGSVDRVEAMRLFLDEEAPKGADSVLYFDRIYKTVNEEDVPYYRVYVFKRSVGADGNQHFVEEDFRDISEEEAIATYGKFFDEDEKVRKNEKVLMARKEYVRGHTEVGDTQVELEGAVLMLGSKPEGKEEETSLESFQGAGAALQHTEMGEFGLWQYTKEGRVAVGVGRFQKPEKQFWVGRLYLQGPTLENANYEADFWLYQKDLEVKAFVAEKNWSSYEGAALVNYIAEGYRAGAAGIFKQSNIGTPSESLYGGHFYLTDPNYANALVLSTLYQNDKDLFIGGAGELVLDALDIKVGSSFIVQNVGDDPDYAGVNYAQVQYSPNGSVVKTVVANGVRVDFLDSGSSAELVGGVVESAGGFAVEAYYPGAGEIRYRSSLIDAALGGSEETTMTPASGWAGVRYKWSGGQAYVVFTASSEKPDKSLMHDVPTEDRVHTIQGAAGVMTSITPTDGDRASYTTVLALGVPFMYQTQGENTAYQFDPQFGIMRMRDLEAWSIIFGLRAWGTNLIDREMDQVQAVSTLVIHSQTPTGTPVVSQLFQFFNWMGLHTLDVSASAYLNLSSSSTTLTPVEQITPPELVTPTLTTTSNKSWSVVFNISGTF